MMPISIRCMLKEDVPQVSKIDRDVFPTDWPPTNFSRELQNRMAHYIVAYEPASAHIPESLAASSRLQLYLNSIHENFQAKRD